MSKNLLGHLVTVIADSLLLIIIAMIAYLIYKIFKKRNVPAVGVITEFLDSETTVKLVNLDQSLRFHYILLRKFHFLES